MWEVPSGPKRLAHLPTVIMDRQVHTKFSEIEQATKEYFQSKSDRSFKHLMNLLDSFETSSLNLRAPTNNLEYYCISESEDYTIAVFILKKGETMPIHDHPLMTVFTKVLKGEALISTYAPLESSSTSNAFRILCLI
jgi:quercetin dioxygenase-like cupin family protein